VRHLVLGVLVALLVGCGGGADGTVAWRDLSLELPDGWVVFEEEDTRLSVASEPLGAEIDDGERPEGDVVAVFLTYEPRTIPDDWRRYAEERGAVVEEDRSIEVGGVPATRFQLLEESDATTTRELVVVVPARDVVLLAQPVPDGTEPGDLTGLFDAELAAFDELLGSISWGAPVEDQGASGAPMSAGRP
jgi:hypothetical protein